MTPEAFLALPPDRRAAPVVVLAGDEPFFKEEAIAAVEAALGAHDKVERRAPVSGRGGAAPDLAPILDELRTGSLFSPAKLVLVREGDGLLAAAGNAVLLHARRGRQPGARIALVLDVLSLDRRSKAGKALAEEAVLVECKRLYADPPPWARGGPAWDTPLVQWTVARSRRIGIPAIPEIAWQLTQLTGNDLHEIASTLDKVRLSGAAELTPAHVESLAGRTRRDDAFAVADALGRRDAARAFEVLGRIFSRGLEDRRGGRIGDAGAIGLIVFGRIYAKLQEIRRTVAYLAAGGARGRDAVAQALGLPPFLAERALAEAERFRSMDFPAIWGRLLEADLALKGALPGGGPRAALERLVLALLNEPPGAAKIPATAEAGVGAVPAGGR